MEGLLMKYFVLKPRSKKRSDPHAIASRMAMATYARVIASIDPDLSQQLQSWVDLEVARDNDLPATP